MSHFLMQGNFFIFMFFYFYDVDIYIYMCVNICIYICFTFSNREMLFSQLILSTVFMLRNNTLIQRQINIHLHIQPFLLFHIYLLQFIQLYDVRTGTKFISSQIARSPNVILIQFKSTIFIECPYSMPYSILGTWDLSVNNKIYKNHQPDEVYYY